MSGRKIIISIMLLGLVTWGCVKEKPKAQDQTTEKPKKTEEKETEKEAAMGVSLQWLGHASFKIRHDKTVIYIDPWKLKMPADEATLVLISHSHYDHYSAEDIVKVTGPNTKLIAPPDVIATEKGGELIAPGVTIEAGAVKVTGVAAYNTAKQFHPKSNKWVGFIIEVGGKRICYVGDTDLTDEMKTLKNIDVALLPVGGKYTMNAEEAAEATKIIKPKKAVPYHYGDIVGSRSDAEKFSQLAGCEVKILKPGETMNLE